MHSSKLFDIINTFDQAKINNLNQYLNIYRARKENVVIRLFDIIYEVFPALHSNKLNKESVHKVLFPTKTFDEKRILNIMSDLLKLVEEFIAYYSAKNNTLYNNLYLLEYYLEYDLNKQFESLYKETKEILNTLSEDTNILIYNYKLEIVYVDYQLKYNKRSSNYQNCYTAINNLSTSQHKKLDNLLNINLYKHIDTGLNTSSLAALHSHLNQLLLNEENYENYKSIKRELINAAEKIAKDELVVCIIIAINFCINQVNKKKEDYNIELLFWYDFMIQNNCLLETNGTVSSAIVKNYITMCIRTNDLKKSLDFLETYEHYLDEAEKEDIYNYNKANILFHQHKYEESLILLTTAKYKDVFYKISSKRLYIKIYYALTITNEKKYFDVLESALNAFKKYVYTTKEITENIRTRNKSFYKYTTKLCKLHKNEKAKLYLLLNEITNDVDCADRDWLTQMIETNI